jgi:hypothetical protein
MDGSTESPQRGEFPAFVDPVKESPIIGTILGFDRAPTKFSEGKNVVIANLDIDGETRALWLTSTVLRSQFARLRPEVGERVQVEYRGVRQGFNAEYHNFAVTMPDRPPYVPDWDEMEDEGAEEAT